MSLRKFALAALLCLGISPALAQSAQLGAGQIWANSTAAQRPATATNVSPLIDRALGSTRGAILERGAAAWGLIAPGTIGLPFVSGGAGADPAYAILGLSGGGCNAALTASNGGIIYSTATACAVLPGTATARQMLQSGASGAPAWSTTTWPATTTISRLLYSSAANVITDLATANGGALNTSATGVPSVTPTPVLGVAGTVVGSIGFQNLTSGTATLQPVTGALGTPTILIPAASGTMAVSVSAPITLNASTGALACATCVTSSGGGAITGTAPIAVSAAGVVSITSPLPLTNGGTNASLAASTGGIVYSAASALAVLSGTATASLPLLSGASAAPTWATIGYPTSAVSGGVPFFSSTTGMGSSALLTANQIMVGGGAATAPTTFACATTTTLVHGGTPPTCGQVVFADIASAAIATQANYYAAAASVLVPASVIYPPEVTITYGSTTTLDFSTFINGVVTLTANISTLTLSNVTAGKAGQVRFVQSGAGSFTWPAGGNTIFKYAGGTLPALTTGSTTAVDVLAYNCSSATFCTASLLKDVRNP